MKSRSHRKLLISFFRLAGMSAVLAGVSGSAQAPLDVRVALIIGNSAYAKAPLLNPANDAQAMSEGLRKLYVQSGPTRNIKLWVDPRYGDAIKREEMGRMGGRIGGARRVRSDRRELVALRAERG